MKSLRVPGRTALVVPSVLVIVAALQIGRVLVLDQSSWQGAGFGMFATYDFDDTRVVVATAVDAHGTERLLPIEPIGADLYLRARVTPTDRVLGEVAARLAPTAPPGTERLTVQVRGPELDGDEVTYHVIRSVTVRG